MHGLILVTILATAKSAEAEITMEAAFQGTNIPISIYKYINMAIYLYIIIHIMLCFYDFIKCHTSSRVSILPLNVSNLAFTNISSQQASGEI